MESIATAYLHPISNYRFQTANYVMYIYDHLMTFSDEVDKIWSQKLTFATLLFYINRYITHCQFIILQVEFQETTWTDSMCDRYVRFAGAATLSLVVVAELTMILRIYALYLGNKFILLFLLLVLSGQICFMAWAVHFGERVPLPPGFPGCVLTGSSSWFAALWAAPLVTDSCIFILTLWKTLRHTKSHGKTLSTIQIILRDGTIYFAVIFSANLMNTLIYFLATEDLKAVGASFSQILTSIMISRLQLNLRRSNIRGVQLEQAVNPYILGPERQSGSSTRVEPNSFKGDEDVRTGFFSIGNLGEELHGTFFDEAVPEELQEENIELQDMH